VACTRCGTTGACACNVVAGANVIITGSGSPANPWNVSAVLPAQPPLALAYDGVNGATAPDIVLNNYVICSPGGGGVPGAPTQAAADFPATCPDSGFPRIYQTATGLRGEPLKKETITTIIAAPNMWVNRNPVQPLFTQNDERGSAIHTITNQECWTMDYYAQFSYHSIHTIIANVGGVSWRSSTQVFLIINGVRNPTFVTHLRCKNGTDALPTLGGTATEMDNITPGKMLPVATLVPGAAFTLQPTRDVTFTAGAVDGSGIVQGIFYGSNYQILIHGVPR